MKPLGPQREHYMLVQGMLQRTGADAETAFADGDLSSEAWASLVTACRGCAKPCSCRAFLADPDAVMEDPPAYCQNAQRLADLPRRPQEECV